MAYTEPYPVITTWPGTTGHPIGLRRCYHYTLTYDQVAKLASDADTIGENSDANRVLGIAIPAILDGAIARAVGVTAAATIGGIAVTAGLGASVFLAWCDAKQRAYRDECRIIGNIWKKIANYMQVGNYKRVTISQLIELDAIYGIDLFPEGFPIWRYEGYPRVPDISYYYKQ